MKKIWKNKNILDQYCPQFICNDIDQNYKHYLLCEDNYCLGFIVSRQELQNWDGINEEQLLELSTGVFLTAETATDDYYLDLILETDGVDQFKLISQSTVTSVNLLFLISQLQSKKITKGQYRCTFHGVIYKEKHYLIYLIWDKK